MILANALWKNLGMRQHGHRFKRARSPEFQMSRRERLQNRVGIDRFGRSYWWAEQRFDQEGAWPYFDRKRGESNGCK